MQLEADGVSLKLVYDGPVGSGKTTNLRQLHARLAEERKGRLIVADGRTSSLMDLLPIFFDLPSRRQVRIRVYTAPGSDLLASARKMVFQGADGVVFVASSAESARAEAGEGWKRLHAACTAASLDPGDLPIVIQMNKRDAPDARPDADLEKLAARGSEPLIAATASKNEGVVPTFFKIMRAVYRRCDAGGALSRHLGTDEKGFIKELGTILGSLPPLE